MKKLTFIALLLTLFFNDLCADKIKCTLEAKTNGSIGLVCDHKRVFPIPDGDDIDIEIENVSDDVIIIGKEKLYKDNY